MTQLQAFPNLEAPFAMVRGMGEELPAYITQPYAYLLRSLWDRTGAAQGILSGDVAVTAGVALASASAAQSTANVALSDATDAQLTADAAQTLAATALQSGSAVGGWVVPTGAGLRTTFDMNWTTTVGAAYSQVEVTAVRDQLIAVQKRLGQLEIDLLALGAIKP